MRRGALDSVAMLVRERSLEAGEAVVCRLAVEEELAYALVALGSGGPPSYLDLFAAHNLRLFK